ncbi:Unknown protein sequence [Pseudomonas syringae pv. maculicola]|uniref:Uncharacterized protein n=1 Tax=Pseudomonas syringae pv. actinidiae TaxID=103796 RepID=A0A2V0Q9Q0_PSESF|nr:Unknown protein sequence [Pseudomonas syringae pv. maculicola]KPC06146.1 Unknown protein sequence [Pseudomonas syringae pv. maculicola str. M6]KPC07822.1 Unknown protein sequence [Pseudomonas amygdali pv. lachrymans]GBH06955.1 hypothetical protein KPSA1_00288 [Pseudomonas syringae pv. actinidiae]KPB89057.1 Unknown protein sequence [Pseudomonas syringae pv. maculicola]
MPDTWHKGGCDDNRVAAFLFPDGLPLTRLGQRLQACE